PSHYPPPLPALPSFPTRRSSDLLVGAVVTSQTLYAATAASMKEYAVLRAMGIPRWRMALTVLAQSFWVGVAGVALAIPTVFALRSEEHTSELQSLRHLVCRLLLE